jgi:hypothetical protein
VWKPEARSPGVLMLLSQEMIPKKATKDCRDVIKADELNIWKKASRCRMFFIMVFDQVEPKSIP